MQQQLIEFAMNHWILVAAFLLVSGVLVFTLLQGDKGSVDPLAAIDLINHEDAVLVDVRPAADFHKGHVINAVNIPINGFANQIKSLNKYKSRPIIVGCRSGSQSQTARNQLLKAGFERVYNLRGGMLAWQNANLPMSRKK